MEKLKAKESGDAAAVEKYSKRDLKVTKEHNEEASDCLMGVPNHRGPVRRRPSARSCARPVWSTAWRQRTWTAFASGPRGRGT